jgi:hypothetical protein
LLFTKEQLLSVAMATIVRDAGFWVFSVVCGQEAG